MASFRGLLAVPHRDHLGPQVFHPEHIGPLAGDVHRAHVDFAVKIEARRHRGGGEPVLARPGLGDDAPLAQPLAQQALAHHVVDLVGAGMIQVLPLDIDPGAPELAGQVGQVGHRGGPPGVGLHQLDKFLPEGGILLALPEAGQQFLDGGVQNFWQEGPAVLAVIALTAIGKVKNIHERPRQTAAPDNRTIRLGKHNARLYGSQHNRGPQAARKPPGTGLTIVNDAALPSGQTTLKA